MNMSEFEKQAADVTERRAALVYCQREDSAPSHWDLFQWGAVLVKLLDQVDEATRVLAPQIEEYGHRQILRDDQGWDPQHRLDTAGDELERLREALAPAREAALRYQLNIGHVGVVVDPDAEVDA